MFTANILAAALVALMCGSVLSTPAPASFCNGKANGDYRHPNDCYEHIKCSNGMSHVFDCPTNLLWDDTQKQCEYISDQVSCNGPFSCNGKADGLYPNQDACNSFIMCSNDYGYIMPCPATTHFDKVDMVCDHIPDANCNVP